MLAEVSCRCEASLEDKGRGGLVRSDRDRHAAADRLAPHYRRATIGLALREPACGGDAVGDEAGLGGRAVGAAVAAVVEDGDAHPEALAKQEHPEQPRLAVPRVAVQQQHVGLPAQIRVLFA